MFTSAESATTTRIDEHIVEIVSDSGEGAQRAGQTFGAISAKMGNGVWTVEIIPAEIKPPARSPQGASGIRIRLGSRYITNMGDQANLVVAFNEQVLRGRIDSGAYEPGTLILLESKWRTDPSETIVEQYKTTVADFRERGLVVHELAMEEACKQLTENPRLGKNMFVLGMLCRLYQRDMDVALAGIDAAFAKKSEQVRALNEGLLRAGYEFAEQQLDFCYEVPPWPHDAPMIVTNGNQAIGLGVMASGIEMVSMYPITPATSASHFLADVFHEAGGVVHQAEDEIAAISFALGTSFAGKTACTITSGPGLALKMESIGLAVMAEIPLVIVSVQRGGPATGLPTKVEQGDLLSALFGAPGDAPKVVLAAATIEECFQFVIVARNLAETFRTPVILLTDANLATGVQSYPRPVPQNDWLSPPIDTSAWDPEVTPYDWDQETGLSSRPIPGQRGGEYVLTGLAHTSRSKVAYDPMSNQRGCEMRSRKLAALQGSLKPPAIHGDPKGNLLLVGWGSTQGAIEEAVDRARAEGDAVSSLHIRFLSPLEPGLAEIFGGFQKVMTIEINYSDAPDAPLITPVKRRIGQLAWLLRAHTLTDIDCWTRVHGQPLQPGDIYEEIKRVLSLFAEGNEE
uniref:2-oxoglutarate ferredoxin oxidoreductase subunit alpha n=1 Tax=Candidatus Kentrum sp. LFY TaxID=2126342 RepID=A0A450U5T2_9GAMM|nr:MAG: 2-oxoglutarate ferredoxin oxidoreductase subunit alpha [Candidatus Kentron sp. LFY]